MNCPNCEVGTIKDGKYICKSDGYHIADSNGDVIFILKQDNIPSDDSEIETFCNENEFTVDYFLSEFAQQEEQLQRPFRAYRGRSPLNDC